MEETQKKKKESIFKRFEPFMGKKKVLMPIALISSAFSAIAGIVPYIFIWLIIRKVLSEPGQIEIGSILTYVWIALAFAVVSIVLYFFALAFSHLAAFRVEVGMQKVGMQRVMKMPLGFFDKNQSGKIRKIILDGASSTHTFLAHQLPDMAGSILSPIILFVLLFVFDWRMGLASLIPLFVGFAMMSRMMSPEGRDFQKQYFNYLEEMSSEAVEYVRGIPVVKTFGQSIFSFKRFYNSINKYKEMVFAYTVLWRRHMSVYTAIIESASFFLVPLAVFLIGRGENLGVVIADYIVYMLIAPSFGALIMRSAYFKQNVEIAKQAIDRFDNLLDYKKLEYVQNSKQTDEQDIEFKNVTFAYEGSEKNAIENISFKVEKGKTVALVGASGGGKTTIARLAARFWDVNEGEILIGGINIKEFSKEDLMNKISFVFQNNKLFKVSIKENITYGKKDVTDEEINRAIELSQSKEIIDGLKEGIDTVIGKKGTYLSGGEQQRIAIARAFLKDSPIVLLDEATAFADPENEHLIQRALRDLSSGKTTLMIAHRMNTIKDADKILVLDKGKIAEEGTHDELMNKNGIYKKMWDEYKKSVNWKIRLKDVKTQAKEVNND